MNVIWNEARVRDELKCLDRKTGLCGADIPIVFNNAKRTLGSFSTHNGKAKQFCFSNHYFQNQDFPVEEAIDTIRHEYAHYMDFVLNGKLGHSTSWKQCCIRIGALPIRLYSEDRADYHRKKHEKERQENAKLSTAFSGDDYRTSAFRSWRSSFFRPDLIAVGFCRLLFQQLGRKLLVRRGC